MWMVVGGDAGVVQMLSYIALFACSATSLSATETLRQAIKGKLSTTKVHPIRSSTVVYLSSLVWLIYSKNGLFLAIVLTVSGSHLMNYTRHEMIPTPAQNITYGVGMACSFFEGYLQHVIPSDGGQNGGIVHNMRVAEAKSNRVFPVKRLFLIITNTTCPPDLVSFNKENSEALGINYLEARMRLESVRKDVAGVKERVYHNSVYCVMRPRPPSSTAPPAPPVLVAAECATPLHTLYLVMQKKAVFKELQNANVDEIRDDFCRMLTSILDNMQSCRGKCELIYFDETDEKQNLADIILKKVEEIEPKFEEIIASKLQNANVDEIRDDFCRMLTSILDNMQSCRGKCELIYFDETDEKQNLADIILKKVEEIEPKFEEIIASSKEH